MVKFGLTNIPTFPSDSDTSTEFERQLERVRLARDLGFDSVWVSHHILGGQHQYLQALPSLGRIAAEAGTMTIGTCVLLLPYFHPVPLAEELATLDIISRGRLIVGLGLGGNPTEFAALGLDLNTRVGRFVESLAILKELWTGQPVTFAGRHFQLNGVQSSLRTVQRPHPPIWIGGAADGAVRRAARLGDTWVSSPRPAAFVEDRMALYQQARADLGLPLPDERPSRVDVFLAETTRQALDEARPCLEATFGAFDPAAGQTYEAWAKSKLVIGDPDECLKRLAEYQAFGINHFIIRTYLPGSNPDHAARSIRLLGRHILPALR